MRPKTLEIEGLQSFRDNQIIDFSKINQNGLFGIFGNTGSGKSTILDAITLALYGKIKRAGNSTQGIINTNCKVARVKFTFEILKDGTRLTYRVDREYKRKKDSNIAEPKVVRLIQVVKDEELPICDKATDVNKKIEEILGLTHKDFTKAVVLPQNNFQEFLLLGNKERREMLERVFYLEEYGKNLSDKISAKMEELRTKRDELSGELKRYENSSDEELKKYKENLNDAKKLKADSDKKLKEIESVYLEQKEVFGLVNELKEIAKKEQNIKNNDAYIEKQKERLELANRASTIIEKIDNAKSVNRDMKEAKKALETCEKELYTIEQENKDLYPRIEALKEELKNRESLQKNVVLELDVKALEKDIQNLVQKEEKLELEQKGQEKIYKELENKANALEEQYNSLKKSEINSMCLFLINNLNDGDKCPVCGNVYHKNRVEEQNNEKIDIEKLEALNKELTNINQKKVAVLARIDEKNKTLLEYKENRKQKENILNQKNEEYRGILIQYKISSIQKELEIMSKKDKEIQALDLKIKEHEESVGQINIKKTTQQSRYEMFSKQLEQERIVIESEMKKKGFSGGTKEVEESVLKEDVMEKIKSEIEEHTNSKQQLLGQKKNVNEKLKDRSITEDEWNTIENKYNQEKEDNKRLDNQYAVALKLYENSEKNNKIWREIWKSFKETELCYDKHDSLRKLLNGDKGKDNSFIDFVAEERLRYVARKASELLGVMTQYKYALRLDAESGFIIIDNQNGGVARNVNTLSGGETFLTSLALALALSEQIQLKGQSPLEFFFLDEGFGSLDNELLDLVIDALERISKKERVIGVISHIPELRQRIAQRVMVKAPSDSGQGSLITIEKG